MGNAYLVRRGGVSDDALQIISGFGGFPSSPDDNTVMIEANTAGRTFIQGVAPAEATDGDAYLSTSRPDKTIHVSDSAEIAVSGAHVKTNGAWEFADTYFYRDSTWHFLWSGQLIYPSATQGHTRNYVDTEYTDYTGGFVTRAAKGGDNASAPAAAPAVIRGENDITVDATATGVSGAGMFYTAKMIDLTPYKTIVFEGDFTRGYTVARNFTAGAWSKLGTYYENNLLAYTMMSATSGTRIEVDVSKVNAAAYIGLGLTYSKATITRAYLVPKDV